jgi:hypothetical protein
MDRLFLGGDARSLMAVAPSISILALEELGTTGLSRLYVRRGEFIFGSTNDSMSHCSLVCGFLDGGPVVFYDLFVDPLLLYRMCLLQWLAGSNCRLQSAEKLDLWNTFSKRSLPYSIHSVPETVRGFQELYSSDQWWEVLCWVRAPHLIIVVR